VQSAAGFAPEATVAATLASNNAGGKQSGFMGGAQIGYNLQLAPAWVVGVETDIQGLSNSNGSSALTATSAVPIFITENFTSTTAVSKRVDYLGTLRGRLGFLLTPNLLFYGTGGLAYGSVYAATSITQTDAGIFAPGPVSASYTSAASIDTTRAGWTAGAGAEMRLWDRWTGKLEYLYYDLGSVNYSLPNLVANVPLALPAWTASAVSSARFNGNIVRVGLNYKF
jgi:outer membrane immunogenic protein